MILRKTVTSLLVIPYGWLASWLGFFLMAGSMRWMECWIYGWNKKRYERRKDDAVVSSASAFER